LILNIPAVAWLSEVQNWRRIALVVLAVLIVAQGALFQWRFSADARSPRRLHLFDTGYPGLLQRALVDGRRPIYLADAYGIPGYIQAFWYATVMNVPLSNFNHLPVESAPPSGFLVISTKPPCTKCEILGESPPYTLFVAPPAESLTRVSGALTRK